MRKDVKDFHLKMPLALYEELHRLLPGVGQKTAFLIELIEVLVEDQRGTDGLGKRTYRKWKEERDALFESSS